MSARDGRALAAGIAVGSLYVASAILSGHLSPLARAPVLDGLPPATAYRWVDPPPELADTNLEPTPGSFRVQLAGEGSRTAVFTTDDAQVTLILPRGAFAAAPGQRVVDLTVEPVAPSQVADPPRPEQIRGNVYRLAAAYGPSGDPAPLAIDARVVLVYPLLSGDHGGHDVLVSRRGRTWTAVDTNDLPSIQQADGPVDVLGFIAVGARPATSPSASPAVEAGGSPVATIVIVAALVVLAVGAAVALRPRRRAR